MSKELGALIFPEELLDIFEVVSYEKTKKGTVSTNVIDVLADLPEEVRATVEEITIDLVPTMKVISYFEV